MSWLRLKELAAQGHEIANHTWTHIPLTKIRDGQRINMDPAKLDADIGNAYAANSNHKAVIPARYRLRRRQIRAEETAIHRQPLQLARNGSIVFRISPQRHDW